MPRAREWADEFEEGIKKYGISADQIQRYTDADWNTMHEATIDGPTEKIRQNASQGRRTLLLCFYAGRGATLSRKTTALLNSNERGEFENQN